MEVKEGSRHCCQLAQCIHFDAYVVLPCPDATGDADICCGLTSAAAALYCEGGKMGHGYMHLEGITAAHWIAACSDTHIDPQPPATLHNSIE